MAGSLFSSLASARSAAGNEYRDYLQRVGAQSPAAMAGAALGGLLSGWSVIDQDPRVVRAGKMQSVMSALKDRGLDFSTDPQGFLGSLAQELHTQGLHEEAFKASEQFQELAAQAAKQRLAETRGRLAEEQGQRAAELHGGRLLKSQADAAKAEVGARYAEQSAQLGLAAKQAAIESSRASAFSAAVSAQTAQERSARSRELHQLEVDGRRVRIDLNRKKLAESPIGVGRPLTDRATEKFATNLTAVDDLSSLLQGANTIPNLGGKPVGDTRLAIARMDLPLLGKQQFTDTEIDFWRRYKAYETDVRHGKFGASLTETERKAFENISVNPSLSTDVIKRNLAQQLEIVRKATQRRATTFRKAGFAVPEAFESQATTSPSELSNDELLRQLYAR